MATYAALNDILLGYEALYLSCCMGESSTPVEWAGPDESSGTVIV